MFLFPSPSFNPAVAITFLEAVPQTGAKGTWTFSSANIGVSTAAHKVVVGTAYTGLAGSFTSITVDGNTMVSIESVNAGDTDLQLMYYDGLDKSSGDVVVTLSSNADRLGIAIWQVDNAASGAASDSGQDSDNSNPQTFTLNVPARGAGLAYNGTKGTHTATWAGLTETFDQQIEAVNFRHNGANLDIPAGDASLSVSNTLSGTSTPASAFASFGPA
jgi:hypothetical protein